MAINRVLIKPIQTGDRLLDQWNRESLLQQADVYSRIEALEATNARIMPADTRTDLWWPLDELPGQVTARNIGTYRQPNDSLVCGDTCVAGVGGLLIDRCRRLFGADATRGASGAFGMTGSTPVSTSLTCWARLGFKGGVGGAATNFVFGYLNAANTLASIGIGINATGLPYIQVQCAAGTRTVSGTSDMHIGDGVWHHLCASYDGTNVRIVVDGFEAVTSFAGSQIDWAIAATPSWRLGLIGSANSFHGQLQDCRMHSTVRNNDWCIEAYRRGVGTYGS